MLLRQYGHVALLASHSSIHSKWKQCWQPGKTTTMVFDSNSTKQIEQVLFKFSLFFYIYLKGPLEFNINSNSFRWMLLVADNKVSVISR